MFVRMLKLPDESAARYDVSSLRVAIHAAAPCPVEVKQAMIDWWGPILLRVLQLDRGQRDHVHRPAAVAGAARLGRAWRASASSTSATTTAASCRPARSAPSTSSATRVPFEYHNDPEKTRAAQHPEHPTWTTIGDLGYVDEDGYLFLTDRKAFMIISGGVNIYPQEIEDVLTLHPAVLDVAVIGVPDEEMGESVSAVVQPAPGAEPSEALAERAPRATCATASRATRRPGVWCSPTTCRARRPASS